MNSRVQTFIEAGIPNDETLSGIRRISIGSIALLQMINNPFANVLLTGGDLPLNDPKAVLEFVYIHSENIEQVTKEIMKFRVQPEIFTENCIKFGLGVTSDELVEIIHDIMNDRDNIQNAKTKSISEGKSHSKNEQCQV